MVNITVFIINRSDSHAFKSHCCVFFDIEQECQKIPEDNAVVRGGRRPEWHEQLMWLCLKEARAKWLK